MLFELLMTALIFMGYTWVAIALLWIAYLIRSVGSDGPSLF